MPAPDAIDVEYTVISDDGGKRVVRPPEPSTGNGGLALKIFAGAIAIALISGAIWLGQSPSPWPLPGVRKGEQARIDEQLSAPTNYPTASPISPITPLDFDRAATALSPPIPPERAAFASTSTQAATAPLPPAMPIAAAEFSDCFSPCPAMIRVRGDQFLMGATEAFQAGQADETPAHIVTVRDFAVSQHEVTVDNWRAFVEATGQAPPENDCLIFTQGKWKRNGSWLQPGFAQSGTHPVTCVNEADAQAYVAWLSKAAKAKYRLLREDEWEFLARNAERSAMNAAVQQVAARPRREGTSPVEESGRGAIGLFDLPGDVWEMTSSCYTQDYQSPPALTEDGRCAILVVRGGSWMSPAGGFRLSQRNAVVPSLRSSVVGFRIARDL